jgi:RNase P subunit RPR2
MSKNRSTNNSRVRKQNAKKAVIFLSAILKDNKSDLAIMNSAARSLVRMGKKHGIRPSSDIYKKICRTCESALIPGSTSRVRFSKGFITNTCKICNKLNTT